MTARLALGDGTLASLAPPETSVARALLLNAPLAIADPGTPARLCRSWTRPATTIANALIRRRALAACWRPDNAESSGPIWTDAGRAARLLPQGRGTCLFYSVPFVTDDDELVDRQVVAVATPVPAPASDAPAARAAIAQALTTLIRRRLARIQRTQRIVSAAAIRRERALTRARARSRGRDLEAQPRLFDRQAIREFDAERAAGAQAAHAAGARIDRLARQAHVRAGAPVLELVLVGRR
jgi:hypothetical protein